MQPGSNSQEEHEPGEDYVMASPTTKLQSANHARTLKQLSLTELMFIVTLTAVSIWVYNTFSQTVVLIAVGCLLVFAGIRWYGSSHAVLGGLFGFGAASIVCCLIAAMSSASQAEIVIFVLVGPACGYLLGAFMSLAHDDGAL